MFYKDLIGDAILSCRFHAQYARVIKSIYIQLITNETLRELESLQKRSCVGVEQVRKHTELHMLISQIS